jgi:adenosylcobinamide kinase/adenosylcobinamide-phosphate guanylyltransferase
MSERGRLTLILGGARSGKSRYAEQLAASASDVVFIATAEALDDDMAARIARHRADRPSYWNTIEAPLDLAGAIASASSGTTIIVDCLTLWASNVLFADVDRAAEKTAEWLDVASRHRGDVIVVSNEVGLGIVPDNALARQYRDLLGRMNQQVAAAADDVVLLVAGIPMHIKRA